MLRNTGIRPEWIEFQGTALPDGSPAPTKEALSDAEKVLEFCAANEIDVVEVAVRHSRGICVSTTRMEICIHARPRNVVLQ